MQDGKTDVEKQDHHGANALFLAAIEGHLELVQWLVQENNMDVDRQDVNSNTTLMCTAWRGHVQVAAWLVCEGGANADAVNNNGETAAALSNHHNHHLLTVLLLSLGASPWPAASTQLRSAAATVAQARRERCSDVQSALASDLPPSALRALVAGYADDAVGAVRAMWVGEESGGDGGSWDVVDAGDLLAW